MCYSVHNQIQSILQLLSAINNKHIDLVLNLMDAGAEVDIVDHNNNSLLHIAAKHENVKLFDRLIGLGVNPSIQNLDRQTVIDVLIGMGSKNIPEFKHNVLAMLRTAINFVKNNALIAIVGNQRLEKIFHVAVKYNDITLARECLTGINGQPAMQELLADNLKFNLLHKLSIDGQRKAVNTVFNGPKPKPY